MLLILALAGQVGAQGKTPLDGGPHIDYSQDPGVVLVSFREILPEFRDQDDLPMVRLFGDGTVLVHLGAHFKRAGDYKMKLEPEEFATLRDQIVPVLASFDTLAVEAARRASEERIRADARASGKPEFYHVADAEISVFTVNLDAYRPAGESLTVAQPTLTTAWRGLRFDAARHVDLAPIQSLMVVESLLRDLTLREELEPVVQEEQP